MQIGKRVRAVTLTEGMLGSPIGDRLDLSILLSLEIWR